LESFFSVLTAAVADFAEHGFDSEQRLRRWVDAIRAAAIRDSVPDVEVQVRLRDSLTDVFRRAVKEGGLLADHPGLSRFRLAQLEPRLHDELERRIMTSANLIRLNRDEAIEATVRRFSGWASSVPPGGTPVRDRVAVKRDVRKGLAQLDFVERRVAIDQGAKFMANLSDIVAHDAGALAGVWHSRWRVPGYQYREDHKERDGKTYAVRGSWALERGLMKPGPAGYVDGITRPAEEVFCSCRYKWLYGLRQLPQDMVTKRGRDELARTAAESYAA